MEVVCRLGFADGIFRPRKATSRVQPLRRRQQFLQLGRGVDGQLTRVVLAYVRRRLVLLTFQRFEYLQFGGQEAVGLAVTQHQRFLWDEVLVYTPY